MTTPHLSIISNPFYNIGTYLNGWVPRRLGTVGYITFLTGVNFTLVYDSIQGSSGYHIIIFYILMTGTSGVVL